MFFFLSLYMQSVLGYSPSHTGLAYLPLTAGFMVSAAIATPLVPRLGPKPVIVAGALTAGFQRAFLVGAAFVLGAALVAFVSGSARPDGHPARSSSERAPTPAFSSNE